MIAFLTTIQQSRNEADVSSFISPYGLQELEIQKPHSD